MKKNILINVIVLVIVATGVFFSFQFTPSNDESLNTNGNTWTSEKKDTEASALIDEGRAYYRAGEYDKAIASYNAAIALESENDNAYMGLYNAYYETGRYAEASIAIENYLKNQTVIASAWIRYAELKWQKLNAPQTEVIAIYERAIVATKQAVDTGNLVDIHTNYAVYLTAIGNYDAAIVQLEAAKKLDPSRAKIYDDEIAQLRKMQKQ